MIPMKPEIKIKSHLSNGFPTTFIGPIQLLPTISLHDVLIDETQITSPFRDPGEKQSDAGNLGMKYTVRYGLYMGTGIYNPVRGKVFKTSADDLAEFDRAMVHASSTLRTSTKTWCQTIAYLRVFFNENTGNGFRNLASGISVKTITEELPNNHQDVRLNISKLVDRLKQDDIKAVKSYVAGYAKELYSDLNLLNFSSIEDVEEKENELCCEYIWITEVRYSNLNGDPMNENRPRILEGTSIGFATPERYKRWVRDYVELNGQPIFVSRNIPRQSASQRLIGLLGIDRSKEKSEV
jgi:CRISPR/Cas system type I-B associated protein Csh2 (Cas7 group RAMP superfamily)